jgi:hypothetical protein
VVRLSAPRTGRLYPQEMFLVLFFIRGWIDPRAMVRSEGNMSLKNTVTPPGIDPGTVRLVAQRPNHYATPGHNFDIYRTQIFGQSRPISATACSNSHMPLHAADTVLHLLTFWNVQKCLRSTTTHGMSVCLSVYLSVCLSVCLSVTFVHTVSQSCLLPCVQLFCC